MLNHENAFHFYERNRNSVKLVCFFCNTMILYTLKSLFQTIRDRYQKIPGSIPGRVFRETRWPNGKASDYDLVLFGCAPTVPASMRGAEPPNRRTVAEPRDARSKVSNFVSAFVLWLVLLNCCFYSRSITFAEFVVYREDP